jgi:Zn-finger nucleic acid-binding protein
MLCPRCKLSLKKVDYEGVETDMCDGCWGFWLDRGELEDVLERRDLTFSDAEREKILDIREASERGPTAPAPCPKCKQLMERLHYDELVHLVVDRCEDHGIWLDTGEIKKIQALADSSEAAHRLLLRKLGFFQST